MKSWLRRWGPALIIMALIFIASSMPGTDLPKFGTWDLLTKKGGHMCGYAMLASAFLHALSNRTMTGRNRILAAIALASLYAMTDEFHQRFTAGRSPSMGDVGIDSLGAIAGAIIWNWISGPRGNREPASRS